MEEEEVQIRMNMTSNTFNKYDQIRRFEIDFRIERLLFVSLFSMKCIFFILTNIPVVIFGGIVAT